MPRGGGGLTPHLLTSKKGDELSNPDEINIDFNLENQDNEASLGLASSVNLNLKHALEKVKPTKKLQPRTLKKNKSENTSTKKINFPQLIEDQKGNSLNNPLKDRGNAVSFDNLKMGFANQLEKVKKEHKGKSSKIKVKKTKKGIKKDSGVSGMALNGVSKSSKRRGWRGRPKGLSELYQQIENLESRENQKEAQSPSRNTFRDSNKEANTLNQPRKLLKIGSWNEQKKGQGSPSDAILDEPGALSPTFVKQEHQSGSASPVRQRIDVISLGQAEGEEDDDIQILDVESDIFEEMLRGEDFDADKGVKRERSNSYHSFSRHIFGDPDGGGRKGFGGKSGAQGRDLELVSELVVDGGENEVPGDDLNHSGKLMRFEDQKDLLD